MIDKARTLPRGAGAFPEEAVEVCGNGRSHRARSGRLAPNVATGAVNLVGTALAALWFTPYLTHKLGVSGYGLVALANSLVPYLALSTVILTSAVSRHVTVHMEKGDELRASQTLNTCFWGSLALAALLTPAAAAVIVHSDSLFVVPASHHRDFAGLLSCMFAVFLFITLGLPFQAVTVARNRLDVSNAISLGYTLVRVGVVVLIFTFAAAKAWHVGAGMAAAGVASLAASVAAWRSLVPKMRISPRLISRSALAELTSTGSWALLDAAGCLLYLNTELIVVNRMLGPTAAGQYGAVLQWPLLIRGGMLALSPVFLPPMLYLFARRDLAGLGKCCRQSIRVLGLAAAVPIGLVCGLSQPILRVWLGSQTEHLAPLLALMTGHLAINMSAHPLLCMQLAANRVKVPAIVTFALGLVNVGAAVWLAGPVGWGLYGVAAAGVITLTLRMLVFAPVYAGRTVGVSSFPIYRELLLVGLVTAAAGFAGRLVSLGFHLDNWFDIGAAACAISAVFGLAAAVMIRTGLGRESIKFLIAELQGGGRQT